MKLYSKDALLFGVYAVYLSYVSPDGTEVSSHLELNRLSPSGQSVASGSQLHHYLN